MESTTTKSMSKASNVVCIRHPQYNGTSNPDLSCKICCSKFVEKIRASQATKLDNTGRSILTGRNNDFTPMTVQERMNSASRNTNFDTVLV